ncbi:hypothetical protein Taro_017053 [Colocasia esculenta]|uniref:Uncharacterized protein n=1 Tax=Colocasia esculenta TaxID=4460 RepID=A0A843UFB6_COLES|nr:hypothetical protein [Colocasia esculenta]
MCGVNVWLEQDLLQFSWSWRPGVVVDLLASRLAVVLGGRGVDANLRILQVRARRTFPDRRPVQGRAVAVQGWYLQLCSGSFSSVV